MLWLYIERSSAQSMLFTAFFRGLVYTETVIYTLEPFVPILATIPMAGKYIEKRHLKRHLKRP